MSGAGDHLGRGLNCREVELAGDEFHRVNVEPGEGVRDLLQAVVWAEPADKRTIEGRVAVPDLFCEAEQQRLVAREPERLAEPRHGGLRDARSCGELRGRQVGHLLDVAENVVRDVLMRLREARQRELNAIGDERTARGFGPCCWGGVCVHLGSDRRRECEISCGEVGGFDIQFTQSSRSV